MSAAANEGVYNKVANGETSGRNYDRKEGNFVGNTVVAIGGGLKKVGNAVNFVPIYGLSAVASAGINHVATSVKATGHLANFDARTAANELIDGTTANNLRLATAAVPFLSTADAFTGSTDKAGATLANFVTGKPVHIARTDGKPEEGPGKTPGTGKVTQLT